MGPPGRPAAGRVSDGYQALPGDSHVQGEDLGSLLRTGCPRSRRRSLLPRAEEGMRPQPRRQSRSGSKARTHRERSVNATGGSIVALRQTTTKRRHSRGRIRTSVGPRARPHPTSALYTGAVSVGLLEHPRVAADTLSSEAASANRMSFTTRNAADTRKPSGSLPVDEPVFPTRKLAESAATCPSS